MKDVSELFDLVRSIINEQAGNENSQGCPHTLHCSGGCQIIVLAPSGPVTIYNKEADNHSGS